MDGVGMKTVTAKVKAPQGGIRFEHDFEGGSVEEVLLRIVGGLDLESADHVTITIRSEPVVEGTAVEDTGKRPQNDGQPGRPPHPAHPDGPRAFGA